MKISNLVIQNRNILVNTENDFDANYKGKNIVISTNHGLGKAKYDHLKRFNIDVTDIESGCKDVQTWEDFHTMRDAIRYALIGACLLKN
jgi:adenylosuccinate synthase